MFDREWIGEANEVERTVDVWLDWKGRGSTCVRIEVLRSLHPSAVIDYSSRSYIKVETSYPATNQGAMLTGWHWVAYDAPSILTAKSADAALRQTLSFLSERAER